MSTATTTITATTTYAETEAVRAFTTVTAAEALAASNLYWYLENCASITADLALHCDLAPATVSSVVGNIIDNDSFPDRRALHGVEFGKALRTAARAAILRMKEAAAARAAQEEAEELAQDLADEKAYQLKRRAELKERNAKRALHPTPAERAMPARATKRIANAMK